MFACLIRRYVTATVLEIKLFANITEGVDSVIRDYKSDFGRLQRRDCSAEIRIKYTLAMA